jgi:hypothetical protein
VSRSPFNPLPVPASSERVRTRATALRPERGCGHAQPQHIQPSGCLQIIPAPDYLSLAATGLPDTVALHPKARSQILLVCTSSLTLALSPRRGNAFCPFPDCWMTA